MSSVTANMASASSTSATAQPLKRPTKRRSKSSNPITSWIWRCYIYIAGTFSLGMMEVWEQLLVSILVVSLSCLIWWSVYFHFPDHIRSVLERGSYYIFGPSSAQGKVGFESHPEL